MNFMVSHDFHEGVRAVVVNKDRQPRWNPGSIEEVNKELVDSYFTFSWGTKGNPLVILSRENGEVIP